VLTNVVKHAEARRVTAQLDIRPDRLRLTARDDGVGLPARDGSPGRGLRNMSSRAKELGGNLALSGDRGTRVELDLPLPIRHPDLGVSSPLTES
jgi:signal transduction histidine kinase